MLCTKRIIDRPDHLSEIAFVHLPPRYRGAEVEQYKIEEGEGWVVADDNDMVNSH